MLARPYSHHSFSWRHGLAGLFALCMALLAQPAWASSVATAAISVGEVTRITAAGRSGPLQLGSEVREGDRILTGRDGMAILVFADQARVSLRAETELLVSRYRLASGSSPADMRLELVRGAMRQISGDAMRAQPERYRLNTPVAAIGVRGTDFLAKASRDAVETFIQEGSIVLLPVGDGCAAQADTRSCAVIETLAASDAMRYLRLTAAGGLERKGVTPVELEQLFGIRLAKSAPGAAPRDATLAQETPRDGSPSIAAAATTSWDRPQNQVVAGLAQAADQTSPSPSGASNLPGSTSTPVVTPDPAPVVAMPTQLIWGRFYSAAAIPVTPALTLPVSYAKASEGRHVTVGEPFEYALWRSGASGQLQPGLKGQVSYSLAAAEGYFQATGSSSASLARVESARLSIDFDQSTFSSAFQVNHAATGLVQIAASGRMNDEGIFSGGTSQERISGAVTRDGTEAGAQFYKALEAGTLRGISLWRARP